MAQYGLQPNGMIRLQNGSLWNPQDPLPPEDASAFNATPMGNPLGQPAPTASIVPAQAPAAPPSGMFGAGPQTSTPQPAPMSDDYQVQPIDAGLPNVKLHAFDKGGVGSKIVDGVNTFANTLLAARGNPYGLAWQQGQQAQQQAGVQAQRDAYKSILDFQRQMALERYKVANRDPTALEQQAQAAGLTPGTPAYQSFIKNAVLAPVITTVNGQPMAYSREALNSGIAASGGGESGPQVGSVEGGYRFLGGDPSNQANWQKVQ